MFSKFSKNFLMFWKTFLSFPIFFWSFTRIFILSNGTPHTHRGRSWNTFIFSHRDLRFYYARHISSEFTKLNLQKPKWYDNQTTIAVRRHGMYIPSSKFFAKFFLAFSHCFLLSEPPSIHFLWCWPGLYSCLWLFQGLWLCGSVDLCPCFVPALVCLPLGPCVPSGSTFLVLVPWSPGCSIIPTRMFNGSGLMPLPA